MSETIKEKLEKEDANAHSRKQDHISLAFKSQVDSGLLDRRFNYEPILSGHPEEGSYPQIMIFGKKLHYPLWVSSMTGGTEWATTINRNLGRVCAEFKLGMGLGSCRSLLYSDEFFDDFNIRPIIGEGLPLFANLGIAQLEQLTERKELGKVDDLIERLRADGLIIHVNPLQEWLQKEGDHILIPPIETIRKFIERTDYPIIVKEVGQGMGPESLRALLRLPLDAVDFAANGGTNFAKLELLRSNPARESVFNPLIRVGHNAEEMVYLVNQIANDLGSELKCKNIIVSGGVKDFLDGYYFINKVKLNAIFGQASSFLRHARGNYDDLREYTESQVRGLEICNAFLKVKR